VVGFEREYVTQTEISHSRRKFGADRQNAKDGKEEFFRAFYDPTGRKIYFGWLEIFVNFEQGEDNDEWANC